MASQRPPDALLGTVLQRGQGPEPTGQIKAQTQLLTDFGANRQCNADGWRISRRFWRFLLLGPLQAAGQLGCHQLDFLDQPSVRCHFVLFHLWPEVILQRNFGHWTDRLVGRNSVLKRWT